VPNEFVAGEPEAEVGEAERCIESSSKANVETTEIATFHTTHTQYLHKAGDLAPKDGHEDE
jgi:hypothetical protein